MYPLCQVCMCVNVMEMTADATAENQVESLLIGGILSQMRAPSGQGTLRDSLVAPQWKTWQERVGRVGSQCCPVAVVSEAEAPGRCPAGLLWSQTDQDLNSSPTTGEQFLHLWEPQFAPVLTDSDGSRMLPAQGLVHMEFIPGMW